MIARTTGRLGGLIGLGILVLGMGGFYAYTRAALKREIEHRRAECTPPHLLTIYREDLFRQRRAEAEQGARGAGTNDQAWHARTGETQVLSSIPFTAKTTSNELVLSFGAEKVAALKFISVESVPFLMVQRSTLFSCDEVSHKFYVERLSKEFRGA